MLNSISAAASKDLYATAGHLFHFLSLEKKELHSLNSHLPASHFPYTAHPTSNLTLLMNEKVGFRRGSPSTYVAYLLYTVIKHPELWVFARKEKSQ